MALVPIGYAAQAAISALPDAAIRGTAISARICCRG
jgi:hypothetical protein